VIRRARAGPGLADIFAARRRLAARLGRTPLAPAPWLHRDGHRSVWLKHETLQQTNAFKIRGALNALAALQERTRPSAVPLHVVTASAGNHGRAVALAANWLGMRATVFTAHDAPRTKLDAIRALGADLRDTGENYDDAELKAKAFAADGTAVFVSPYSDPDVIAGAGTIGLEIVEDLPEVQQIVVPVGGGGLLSGVAIAAKGIDSGIRVVGVEVEASHPFRTSIAAGRLTTIDVGPTLADGLAGNPDPDTITFDLVREHADELTLVSEANLADAIRALAVNERIIVEGAGAAGVAAVLSGSIQKPAERTAVVVSGGNIDLERFAKVIGTR
jgi:threonine dehydratase